MHVSVRSRSVFVSLGVLLVCVLSVPSRAAAAVTMYVSSSGSDSNPGTALQPFRTIQHAADLVNPGDTVIVEDGVYTGTGTGTSCASNSKPIVCISRGGTADAPVTFRARNPLGAKLDGRQNQSTDGIRLIGQADYVHIEGFEIFGVGNASGSASGIELYEAGQGAVITQNDVHDIGRLCTDTTNGEVGIYVQQSNVTISRNRIHDIGRYAAGENGCQATTAYYKNHDHGIYANGSTSSGIPGAQKIVIDNNLFWNHARGWAIQAYPDNLSAPSILNNTFAFPNPYNDGHIIIGANTTDGRIVNNIFYSPKTAAVYYYTGTATNLQVTNNMVYGGSMLTKTPSGTTVASNQTVDPRLTNVTSAPYDFHLTSQSLAINAAVSVPEVTVDFDGTPRASGIADVGAYEYADNTTAQVATPTIAPGGGTITGPTSVTLASATTGATIRYTTDGSTPTTASQTYSGPFTVDASLTVKAQAFKSGMLDSQVALASFQKSATDPAPSADTVPPTVAFTTPTDQAKITKNGPVTIAATATDDTGVVKVQFALDGRVFATDTSAPYSTSYNFNKVGAGSHVITATATDAAGNATTASITVLR